MKQGGVEEAEALSGSLEGRRTRRQKKTANQLLARSTTKLSSKGSHFFGLLNRLVFRMSWLGRRSQKSSLNLKAEWEGGGALQGL